MTSNRKMVGKAASVTFSGVVVDQGRRWLQVMLPDGKRRVWVPREMCEAQEPEEEAQRVPAMLATYAKEERWQVDRCPECSKTHTFFAGKYTDPDQYLGTVRAPCGALLELIRFFAMSDEELQRHGYDMGL